MKELCNTKQNIKSATIKSVAAVLLSSSISAQANEQIVETKKTDESIKDKGIEYNNNSSIVSTLSIKSVVQLNFNNEFKDDYKLSVISEKNQIVLDFNGADRTFKAPPIVENDPLISKISSKLIDNKVRVVIETKQPVKFKFLKQGKKGVLLLEESTFFLNQTTGEKIDVKSEKRSSINGVSENWKEVSTRQSIKVENTVTENAFTEIGRINLKKDGLRNTKLTVDVSNKIVPTIKKEGNKLIIDFKNVSIPNELQRRINTENINTITQSLDISMQQSTGRIILEQKENWDYSFYQVESQFVVDIKASDKVEEEKKYVGKKLSISFQDMEVRAILQVIADFTGLNIMSSDQVLGTMTIRLKDVPWDQALDLVLDSRGLQKVKDGNVIWVATSKEVSDNNEAKDKITKQNENSDPLDLEFFQINYYKASDLKNVLEGVANDATANSNSSAPTKSIGVLSSRGSMGVDSRNNMLFVQDTEEKRKKIRKLIKKFDVANKQVLVEAKIVIADNKFGKDIGSKFGVKYRQDGSTSIGIGGNINESFSQANGVTSVTPLTNLASQGINSVSPGVIGLTLLNMATGNALGVELSALEQNNRGKVLSSPRLLTADNKKASIEQGTEIPYVTPGTSGSAPTVSFKKAVLKLEVTPQIAPNGKVVLDLNIIKDSIGQLIPIQGGGQIPSIDTKNIQTMITVNNGQTVVLGGVYEITKADDVQKIPFFGDLPFLGNLFKHTATTDNKGELMIFITPYVIEDKDLDDNEIKEVIPEINLGKSK